MWSCFLVSFPKFQFFESCFVAKKNPMGEGEENEAESNERSLALSPTWSVALVLTVFVLVSLIVERSIYRLSTVSTLHSYVSSSSTFSLNRLFLFLVIVVEEDKEETFICCFGEDERRLFFFCSTKNETFLCLFS